MNQISALNSPYAVKNPKSSIKKGSGLLLVSCAYLLYLRLLNPLLQFWEQLNGATSRLYKKYTASVNFQFSSFASFFYCSDLYVTQTSYSRQGDDIS